MTSGWRCWGDRWRRIAIGLAGLATAAWLGHWWAMPPRTPRALFETRCASCHELRTERVCEFAPELRPAIVDTMRRMHGADAVIDEREARIIAAFLGEPALCSNVTPKQPAGPTDRPTQ